MRHRSEDAQPGWVALDHRIIHRRKTADEALIPGPLGLAPGGWWLKDGHGLSDRAIDAPDSPWILLSPADLRDIWQDRAR